MSKEVTPRRFQEVVKRGFERMRIYRLAQAMFVKEYAGQYYSRKSGMTGDEPLNLLFTTIRTMVPNLVMRNGMSEVTTSVAAQRAYGELLGLALDDLHISNDQKSMLRAAVVDAFFGMGLAKTGISASGEMLLLGDQTVDPGQIYTKLVGVGDFVMGPVCTHMKESPFLGDRIRVPRQVMLDTDGYDHDLVMKLPVSKYGDHNRTEEISKQNMSQIEMMDLQDYVDVVELWVPDANALVTIPDPYQLVTDEYIRATDYYGPKEGPYTELSFTPPVPKNPLPVAPVSLLYDIHRIANRTFKRMMDQADRQKDILVYNPAVADEAQDVGEAQDGDTIAMTDPSMAKIFSYGGVNRNNEAMLQEMQTWYNYMAGNPDQMAGNMTKGTGNPKESATRTSVLQTNASISIEDSRDILYDFAARISRKEAWYLHTDPLINIPLTKRLTGGQRVELRLTPEQRNGDFLRFTFNIAQRSMSRLAPDIRARRIMEFVTNVMPALFNSAMLAMQVGMPFNLQRSATDIAKEQGILEDIIDWFDDPDFEQKWMMYSKIGPQDPGKASMITPGAIAQNGGFPQTRQVMSPGQEFNQNSQAGANDGQSNLKGAY